MKKGILEKIKARGYWQIIFRPKLFKKDKITTLSKCHEIIEKAVVRLRGWDYPHFPTRNDEKQEIYNYNDCIESWIDWGCFKEFWRMYQSGQFIHFFAMIEDWYEEDSFFIDRKNVKPGETLTMIHNIYRVTEICEFLKRLSKQNIYSEEVDIEIKLYGTKDRRIVIDDPMRMSLLDNYIAMPDEIIFAGNYSGQEISIDESELLALNAIIHIFEQFNWKNPPIEVIKNDQERLLKRKF